MPHKKKNERRLVSGNYNAQDRNNMFKIYLLDYDDTDTFV